VILLWWFGFWYPPGYRALGRLEAWLQAHLR
jgi:hypothetical protein